MVAAELLRDNPGQWKAYNSTGNCVILAGPGSGKTQTLSIKLARVLAEDIHPPRNIACITYNNSAARELKKRLSRLGVEDGRRASIGTLHSFCLRHIVLPYACLTPLLKKYPITVASTAERDKLQQEALDKTMGSQERWGPRFDKYRRSYLDRTDASWRSDDEEAALAIEKYESLLDDRGLIDFDGMVLIGLHLVQTFKWVRTALVARFPMMVVDEYQDLGHPLDRIVQCLCFQGGMRLLAVGDPDQSIYGFTGAAPSLLLKLAKRQDVSRIQLGLNYRCGSEIIAASEGALGEQRGFQSYGDEPGAVYIHERPGGIADQVEFACKEIIPQALQRRPGRKLGDVAILYLDKNDGNVVAKAVDDTGWKYCRVDGNNPYQPSPVTYLLEDCAAWCAGAWKTGDVRLSELVRRWLAFNEIVSTEKEGRIATRALVQFLQVHRSPQMPLHEWLSLFWDAVLQICLEREPQLRDDKEKIEKLLEMVSPGGPLESFTVAFFGGQGGSPDHLYLSTLHSAKGLEYDIVIMLGLEDGRIPYYSDSGETLLEKRRLFYVGLTRARHEVHLVYSGWYDFRGRIFRKGRSRFIEEVEAKITR